MLKMTIFPYLIMLNMTACISKICMETYIFYNQLPKKKKTNYKTGMKTQQLIAKEINGHRNADKRANSFWQFLHFFPRNSSCFTMLADRLKVPIALTQFCPSWNLLDISVVYK